MPVSWEGEGEEGRARGLVFVVLFEALLHAEVAGRVEVGAGQRELGVVLWAVGEG